MSLVITSMICAAAATLFSAAMGQVSLLQAQVKTERSSRYLPRAKKHSHMAWHINQPAYAVQSNLGGFGPSLGAEELRIENVSVLHGWEEGHPANETDPNHSSVEDVHLDLLIVAESDYEDNTRTGENGASGDFGMIYVKKNRTETFRFSFVRMGTYEEFVIQDFDFTIFDIDQPGPDMYCSEMVTGWLVEHYASLSNAYHHILEEFDDRVQVCSNVTINNGEVTNPTQVRTLSNAQARASIMFSYRNTSSFRITFTNSAEGPRALVFAGTSEALEPPTGEWHEHFLPLNETTYPQGYSKDFEWILHQPANVTANNLGQRGPNFDDPPEIRFRSVGILNTFDEGNNIVETMMLDLIIFTEDPYWASDYITRVWNGAQGDFGEVGLSRESNVTLIFTFVETDTHKVKVVPSFDFTLFDIDNQADPNLGEEYTVHGAYSYSIVDGAFTIIDDSVPNQVHLKSNVEIFNGAISNPSGLSSLNSNQYKCSVQFKFKETSHWEVDFITTAHTERALVFGPHPRPAINETTVVLPTPSPTPAPSLAPTMSTSTVFGDPHIQNMQGKRFDIERAGSYKFLAIPRGAPRSSALLELVGHVTPRGDPCAGQLYLTRLSIAGGWLGNLSRLELSTSGEGFNTLESVGLRVGDAEGNLSVEDFASRFPPRMASVTRFYPEEPEALNRHVTTLLVRLYLGPTILKITWEHQKEKIGFSNSLMLLTYGLGAVDGDVGGLLGRDDQADATEALDADSCETLRGLVPNQIGHAWAVAHLSREEGDGA